MSASIVADDNAKAAKSILLHSTRQQTVLFWWVLVALLAIAFGMRLYGLGLPFDRDGYDEGVYWQTLLSMHAGSTLYQQIFYSQPPFFMYSTYPFYILFGGTLWSARFAIALVSLLGLVGAFLVWKSVAGGVVRVGASLLRALERTHIVHTH